MEVQRVTVSLKEQEELFKKANDKELEYLSKLFQALGLERVSQKKCWMDSRYHIDRILSYIAKNRLIPKQDLLDAYLLEDLKNLVDKNKKYFPPLKNLALPSLSKKPHQLSD